MADYKQRTSVEQFLQDNSRDGGYFDDQLVRVACQMETISLMDAAEKQSFIL